MIAFAARSVRAGYHRRLTAGRRHAHEPRRIVSSGEIDLIILTPGSAARPTIQAAHDDRGAAGDRYPFQLCSLEVADPLAVRREEWRPRSTGISQAECMRIQVVDGARDQLWLATDAAAINDMSSIRRDRYVAIDAVWVQRVHR